MQDVLLFLILVVTSDRFGVTLSYSSCLFLGYTPCTVPYNTSYLRRVMLSYIVYIILYCNDDWCIKDSVVHCSHQQSFVAKWLGLV